jgi:GTP cyclohydrolase FolE2
MTKYFIQLTFDLEEKLWKDEKGILMERMFELLSKCFNNDNVGNHFKGEEVKPLISFSFRIIESLTEEKIKKRRNYVKFLLELLSKLCRKGINENGNIYCDGNIEKRNTVLLNLFRVLKVELEKYYCCLIFVFLNKQKVVSKEFEEMIAFIKEKKRCKNITPEEDVISCIESIKIK